MAFADEALAITQDILRSIGDEVTLYPVRASEVAAYLGAGLSGTTAVGAVDVRSQEFAEGDVNVATDSWWFHTDETTAAPIVPRRWSLLDYRGRLFDIMHPSPDSPGAVRFYLQEYVE